jgi:hypothetical protein
MGFKNLANPVYVYFGSYSINVETSFAPLVRVSIENWKTIFRPDSFTVRLITFLINLSFH